MPIFHQMPSEASPSGDIARRLLSAIGPAYQAPDGSHNASDALTLGDALADAYTDMLLCMNESFASSATALLSEIEELYGLTVRADLAAPTRRIRLLAKIRAGRAGTPQNILRSVAPYDATATVHENVSSDPYLGDPFGVYVWALTVLVAVYDDPVSLAALKAAIEQLKPAHTLGSLATRIAFRCDDPDSLTNRDVL